MYPTILIVMYHVLFHPFFINGQEIELSFNTPVYEGTNDYYAHIGEDVVLTCTVMAERARVYMNRGPYFSRTYESLVVNGEPGRDLANQPNKFSFHSDNGKYQITIHNLEKSDSLPYRCRFCTPCELCMLQGLFLCSAPVVVQLDVKEINDDSQIPDFCDLISNTDGIFFTGNDLILRCPKLSLSLKVSNGSFEFTVIFETENHSNNFNLLTVKQVTSKLNGTMISCCSVQTGDVRNKDYCRYFPTILVFNEITVLLSGGEREITNGENVTFTCHSHPFLPLSIQWDISNSNVRFENDFVSEIAQGSTITFRNVEFLDSTSSYLTVFCNVTIGSENGFAMASIYPRMEVVSSTQTTSLLLSEISSTQMTANGTMSAPGSGISSTQITANGTMSAPGSGISSTQITASETMSASGSNIPSFSPVSIVIPVIVVVVILGIIALGIVYIKLRKPVSSNEADRRNSNTYQDPVRVEEHVYNTMNLEKTELGLTYHDSEVADNVAYGSYDEDYKRG